MGLLIEVISTALLIVGSIAVLVSGIGIVRMPDIFTRLHAVGITDTVGAAAILLGLSLQYGWDPVLIKMLFLLLLLLVLNPSASHALGRAAVHGVRRPWLSDGG